MAEATYLQRRGQLEEYFDRTAAHAWARLTSDAPVSGIRATVRAGRERMRETLLSMLPAELAGRRILDAGCGTGAMALALARRGAYVVAVDLSPTLVNLARDRARNSDVASRVEFRSGDMTDPALGAFDHIVAMDSLIHYRAADVVRVLGGLAHRARRSMVMTFAPRTPLLSLMHAVGRLFPRGNRAPAIEPVVEAALRRMLAADAALESWCAADSERVSHGFYTSQALRLVRA